jgi:ATP:ADP antiporter, AAA family
VRLAVQGGAPFPHASAQHSQATPADTRRHPHWWQQLVTVKRGEWRPLFWSFSYFFALLCGYYIVRPMRDEMGIAGGVQHLQWLFTGTFVAMLAAVPLFGWLARHYAPRQFLPYVYYFFIGNLLLFFALFQLDITHAYVARAFFIWASVFNLFIVSVFWSFMADIFTNNQARRLFGVIAAGGTAGALTGPALTTLLVLPLGPTNLLPISVAFLAWSVLCIHRLAAWRQTSPAHPGASGRGARATTDNDVDAPVGGGVLAGVRLVLRSPYLIGICLLMVLFTTLATFLYFHQAHIIRDHFTDPAQRTALFAAMDFAVNALTLATQLFLTSRIVARLGLAWTLAAVPLLLAGGFLLLGLLPTLWAIVAVQVVRRAGNYAVMRPAREMLYVVLDKEEKYKSKNFIDTVVYRGGDAVSAWVYAGMMAAGLSIAGISLVALPLAMAWALVAFKLGKHQEQIAIARSDGRQGGIHHDK